MSIFLSFIDMHQGDSLTKPLFVFDHFRVLCCFFWVFFFCFFRSLVDDTHILNLVSFISSFFDHFASQLMFVKLIVQPYKCFVWSPLGFPLGLSPPFGFSYALNGIRVLSIPFGSNSLSFSFLQVMLNEDVWHVETFLRLRDVRVVFLFFFDVLRKGFPICCVPSGPIFGLLASTCGF